MKADASPLALRRPFARLARGIITPDVSRELLDALRARVPAIRVADVLPKWHPRDPPLVWQIFNAELSNAYARIMVQAGRAARVRKDRSGVSSVDLAPELVVPTNPYAEKWIRAHAGELCVELSRQQHASILQVVQQMYAEGRRPEEIADHLRQVVGLTKQQEKAVWSFRESVLADTGDQDIADARAQRYADSQLSYRTEVIGRTENRYAVEQGRRSEWLQARDDGELPATARRVWSSAPASHRLCEACAALDGVEVGLDEPWQSDEGDEVDCPPLHPQCRCTVVLLFGESEGGDDSDGETSEAPPVELASDEPFSDDEDALE